MQESQQAKDLKAQQLQDYLTKIGAGLQSPEEIENDQYVELHFHTEHSSLDGAVRIPNVAKVAKEHGQTAIAVTDHGTMSALFDVRKECKKIGVKLIPAIEPYIVDDATKAHVPRRRRRKKADEDKTEEEKVAEAEQQKEEQKNMTSPDWESHIILLAKNEVGYRNLLRLHYLGYLHKRVNTFGRVVPRIDFDMLTHHKEGIIVGSACLGGQINQALIRGADDLAEELLLKYKNTFGDDFYLELQPVGVQPLEHLEYRRNVIEQTEQLQAMVNQRMVDFAIKHDVMLVCTSDAHYALAEDRETHALLLAIQSKKDITDESCFFFPAPCMQTAKQMAEQFPIEWIKNTRRIADRCEDSNYLDFGSDYKIPSFPIPEDDEFSKWRREL